MGTSQRCPRSRDIRNFTRTELIWKPPQPTLRKTDVMTTTVGHITQGRIETWIMKDCHSSHCLVGLTTFWRKQYTHTGISYTRGARAALDKSCTIERKAWKIHESTDGKRWYGGAPDNVRPQHDCGGYSGKNTKTEEESFGTTEKTFTSALPRRCGDMMNRRRRREEGKYIFVSWAYYLSTMTCTRVPLKCTPTPPTMKKVSQ